MLNRITLYLLHKKLLSPWVCCTYWLLCLSLAQLCVVSHTLLLDNMKCQCMVSSLFACSKFTIILYSLLYVLYHLKPLRKQSGSSKVRSLSTLPVLLAISFSEHERMIPSTFLTTPSRICSSPKYLSQCHGPNLWSIGSVKFNGRKPPLCRYQGNTTRRCCCLLVQQSFSALLVNQLLRKIPLVYSTLCILFIGS